MNIPRSRPVPDWLQGAWLELALLRDSMLTREEAVARQKAVLECFGNPILDPSLASARP